MTATIDKLPFEIILQIFQYLPISSFHTLYVIFPQELIDEALVFKLRNNKSKPLLNLVSTNLHELSADVPHDFNKRNESSICLYYTLFDAENRFIWTLPSFCSFQHYFKVKDAYVSHGKLVIRRPHEHKLQKLLVSLWDIRKGFPPLRAGSFSGASEYSAVRFQEFTIYQPGCVLDSCLVPPTQAASNGVVVLNGDKIRENTNKIQRPNLPLNYVREIPMNNNSTTWTSSYPDPTCGYFLVERLAISIPTFLELF